MEPDPTAGIAGVPAPPSRCDAARQPYRLRELRASIATRLERGETLDTIERELIAPSGLPEEEQSALWLYAWSQPKRPPAPQRSVRSALGDALLTLIGICRHFSVSASTRQARDSLLTTADVSRHHGRKGGILMTSFPASSCA